MDMIINLEVTVLDFKNKNFILLKILDCLWKKIIYIKEAYPDFYYLLINLVLEFL